MLRSRAETFHSALIATDVAQSGVLLMLLLAYPFPAGVLEGPAWTLTPSFLALAVVACLSWPTAAEWAGVYASHRRERVDEIVGKLALAGAASTAALFLTSVALGTPVSTQFPMLFGAAQFSILTVERLGLASALRLVRRFGRNTRNVLIVGSGQLAVRAKRLLESQSHWGFRVVGFLDDAHGTPAPEIDPASIRKLVDIRQALREDVIDEVVVAVPRSMFEEISPVVSACGEAGVPFTIIADFFGEYLPAPEVTRLGSLPALRFAPIHHSRAGLAVKRSIDLVLGAFLLTAAVPVIAVAAVAIRATSSGGVFFKQNRSGLFGRPFQMIKLRTMVSDAEAQRQAIEHLNEMTGPVFKVRNDPRITPVGRFLRRFSIDELPQLWNVLRGEMSLVGPRPALTQEVASYRTFERRRLSMRPGLTCLWQVAGRNRVNDFDDWVRLDLEYIDTWSLGLDSRILLRTVWTVLRATGQ